MTKKTITQELCEGLGEVTSTMEAGTKAAKGRKKTVDRSAGPTAEFATVQDLMKAIAMERNLVEVGSALLGSAETKGASVRARMFETTLEYLYGKPAAAAPPQDLPVRVIWDIPMTRPDEPKE
jgi:hypothetical protein